MKYKYDPDLEFLQNVSSEDLKKLVQILTKSKTEELTKREIYKEFYQEHSVYWQEIAAELQYFGGNTILNVIRREGVLYAEILQDVCKVLGVTTKSDAVEDIESLLLSKKETDLKEKTKQVFKGLLEYSNVLSSPFAFCAKKLADPAYRVTIDAVYEIAHLRKKYASSFKNTNAAKSESETIKEEVNLKYIDSLIITDATDNITLAELKIIEQESNNGIDFNGGHIDSIKQFVADIFKGALSMPNQTVKLVFSSDVQKGLANGTYTLGKQRAFAIHSSNGRFKEHAKIISSGQGQQLFTGGYHLLSIAVAQSHLADIEKSLDTIKNLISQVLDKLEADDKANLRGSIEYIQNIIYFIKDNNFKSELSQEKRHRIEEIIRNVSIWKHKLLAELKTLNDKIQSLEDKDSFGTRNTFDELKKYTKDITPLGERYKLLLELSYLLSSLTTFLDPSHQTFSRIDLNLEEFHSLFKKYKEVVKDGSKELKSYLNMDDTLEERKKLIDLLLNKNCNVLDETTMFYQKKFQKIENLLDRTNSFNTSILVSFDENSNVEKYAIMNC